MDVNPLLTETILSANTALYIVINFTVDKTEDKIDDKTRENAHDALFS
jgi:hypothetical protein